MKKSLFALFASVCAVLALGSCNKKPETPKTPTPTPTAGEVTPTPTQGEKTPTPTPTPAATVLTYEQYLAAEMESTVTIRAAVQDAQGWWSNKQTIYLADENGAYFVYEMPVTEAQKALITKGNVLEITGTKTSWAGEVEIKNVTSWKVVEDAADYVAPLKDVTAALASGDASAYQNQYVLVTGEIVASQIDELDADGQPTGNKLDKPFLYKWDGSGAAGTNSDLYFNVKVGEQTYTFTVESYLRGEGTDVYTAVTQYTIGQKVTLAGFLYWYNGPQMHVTATADYATYEMYNDLALEQNVTIRGYIQDYQDWWNNKQTIYLADQNGAYFVYEMPVTEEQKALITKGTLIEVTGKKTAWAGEVELASVTSWKVVEGAAPYIAEAKDITSLLKTNGEAYMNQLVKVTGEIVASQIDELDADGLPTGNKVDKPFLYKYDGSGAAGTNCDLYFKIKIDGVVYTFVVESYLRGESTDVYKAVTQFTVGQQVTLTGFLYWYNGAQMQVVAVSAAQ